MRRREDELTDDAPAACDARTEHHEAQCAHSVNFLCSAQHGGGRLLRVDTITDEGREDGGMKRAGNHCAYNRRFCCCSALTLCGWFRRERENEGLCLYACVVV